MWMVMIAAVAGIAAYFLLRGPTGTGAGSTRNLVKDHPDLPSKSLNPSEVDNQENVVVWEFLAPNLSTACVYARNNAGVRRKKADCIALPLPDCGSETCACHYRPVFEQRRSHRRKDHDRRESVRFDDTEDRRKATDRRKDVKQWQDERKH